MESGNYAWGNPTVCFPDRSEGVANRRPSEDGKEQGSASDEKAKYIVAIREYGVKRRILPPTRAKAARVGHPQFGWLQGPVGWATRLARTLDLKGKTTEAIALLVSVIQGENQAYFREARLLLARLYRKSGRLAEAQKQEALIRQSLSAADPDHPMFQELADLGAIKR